ncbi:alpha/beta hydrolase [Domibacillus sp. 8LH]|uniref:alpha/beta fold hydrolase n=1 Tax=Domibacillus sp. 8LH TaxID=3073900 RepID=UPI0031808345
MADFLKTESFSVLGVSGGGAYAAAVSYRFPERTRLCVLVSSATPFHAGKPPKNMSKENRIAFFLSKHAPWILKKINSFQKKMIDRDPDKYKAALQKGGRHLPEWDNRQLTQEEVLDSTILHLKEAYRQGVEGALYETRLLTENWGFNLSNIQVPVHIWHGEEDTLSPVSEVKKMAGRFSTVTSRYIKDGGHFLTEEEKIWREILQTIVKEAAFK